MYQTHSNARGEFRILSVEDGAYVLSVEDNPFGRDLRTSVSPDQEQTVAMLAGVLSRRPGSIARARRSR